MRTLDLIQELWDASKPADRCLHLQHDATGSDDRRTSNRRENQNPAQHQN
jgi:hypothetical protein